LKEAEEADERKRQEKQQREINDQILLEYLENSSVEKYLLLKNIIKKDCDIDWGPVEQWIL
jgi:hypothetical protein